MERYRRLNQALQEFLFRAVGFAPHVFPNLMRIVEVLLVKELNAAMISVRVHVQILTGQSRLDALPALKGKAAKKPAHNPVLIEQAGNRAHHWQLTWTTKARLKMV